MDLNHEAKQFELTPEELKALKWEPDMSPLPFGEQNLILGAVHLAHLDSMNIYLGKISRLSAGHNTTSAAKLEYESRGQTLREIALAAKSINLSPEPATSEQLTKDSNGTGN